MLMRLSLTCCAILMIIGAALADPPAPGRCEYRTLQPIHGGPALDQDLNKLGAEGWELVSVTSNREGQLAYYFKRPLAASGEKPRATTDSARVARTRVDIQTLSNACQ